MKRSAREWLLSREENAQPRLDGIRKRAAAPVRASLAESIAEIFRADLRIWVSLVLVWVVLAATQIGMRWNDRATTRDSQGFSEMASLDLASNERISSLDGNF